MLFSFGSVQTMTRTQPRTAVGTVTATGTGATLNVDAAGPRREQTE